MNAFLFTAWIRHFREGRMAEPCHSLIVYGGDIEVARKALEELILNSNHDEESPKTKILKVVGAPVLDQVLTETGPVPLDWAKIGDEVLQTLEATGEGDDPMEQGFWVDCDQCVRPEALSPSLAALEQELPEDLRSSLNWKPEKTCFFLLSVLSPPPPPRDFDEQDYGDPQAGHEGAEPGAEDAGADEVDFPEMAPKEQAVLVRARNSVVAAWLWRRHASGTALAANSIRLDGWPGAVPATAAPQ